ncbi:hypothetical protein NA57DRAFT_50618 [Rhizodiscina lignyota]|uniref:Uncharacterized protein n=1 Tax=Rhizodiscina lignyota TaxID=1504668 RepID=A0A9P4MFQ2_9PEZI|nr:hypothetical protein NA57DRAFT_50618 [Rhizodiscina lignyota]
MEENGIPTDDEVKNEVNKIRQDQQDIGRAKIVTILRDQFNWRISETRLKKLVPSVNQMKTSTTQAELGIPEDAVKAQKRYRDKSTRTFRIYGRGEYNYGVSLNSDVAIQMDIAYGRLAKAGRPKSEEEKRSLASAWPLQLIWDYYVATAKKAGVSKEDVGLQLEAEYGVPWTYMPTPKPEWTGPQAEAMKAKFKEASLQVKRQLMKNPEARRYIPTNANGDIVWDEEKNGQFAVLVVKIDKGDGLREFGEV